MSTSIVRATTFVDNQTGIEKSAADVLGVGSYRALSETNQPIGNTAASFTFEVPLTSTGFVAKNDSEIYHEVTGEYTINLSGHFKLISGSGNILYIWAESSTDGTNWIEVEDSGRVNELDRNSEGEIGYHLTYNVLAGIWVRFRHYTTSGSAEFESSTIPLNGVVTPSVIVGIKQV